MKIRNICKYNEIDFKDTFIIRHEDSWMLMKVPNTSEMKVFSMDSEHKPKLGIVMICERDWLKGVCSAPRRRHHTITPSTGQ